MTFSDLNSPFPLFEAPVKDAAHYHGAGTCSICSERAKVCFELDIGCAIISKCPKCGAENGLDTSDCESTPCRECNQTIPFPAVSEFETILTCYLCLRAGKAAITKDTEIGMISWEQAFEGMTHGAPDLRNPEFELVPTDSGWVRARLPQDVMFELLRTPTYSTIQGDRWQFCCRQPMVFLGKWDRADFTANAPDRNGEAYFRTIVQDIVPGLWEDQLHDITGIYVFRCQKCSCKTAHWDLA